ncbi:hypothetical protein M5K25_009338 [Dendrobium thyrsiflorum]|uniref:protein-serine/threonine phosphatase n=1 Tax=Dendrobium thyrsiflorum TaxID=117978 RepID=A0ABD0VCP1_DENTH
MKESEGNLNIPSQLNVSFGYRCNEYLDGTLTLNDELGTQFESSNIMSKTSSFSCLSGAALSANLTLANTNLWNGLTKKEILGNLDSPQSFRMMRSSALMSNLGLLSLSSHNSISTMASSTSTDIDMTETSGNSWRSMSAPFRMGSSGFLNAGDILMAGGAAGEDRVQAVCSKENGWVFCGIYDGFNGRDAADFLSVELHEKIVHYLYQLEWNVKKRSCFINKTQSTAIKSELSLAISASEIENKTALPLNSLNREDAYFSTKAFRTGLLDSLVGFLAEVENKFMTIVEQTMEVRPDIVSIGSCVLVVLLHGGNLYVLNLGDSRVVLAVSDTCDGASLQAIQLTKTHTVDNASELMKVMADHPDDPSVISGGRVKGILKLTRAFGAGYLKKGHLNDALMGILQEVMDCLISLRMMKLLR